MKPNFYEMMACQKFLSTASNIEKNGAASRVKLSLKFSFFLRNQDCSGFRGSRIMEIRINKNF